MITAIDKDDNLLRPLNLPEHTPGRGVWFKTMNSGHEIVVIHVCGTVFMTKTAFDNPFECVDKVLQNYPLKADRSIFVDFHAEATSEKMALGQYLDGLSLIHI